MVVVNEIYAVGDNNALGNVFLKVEGTFPPTPVPSQPVEIDQSACVYRPRVVGARVTTRATLYLHAALDDRAVNRS